MYHNGKEFLKYLRMPNLWLMMLHHLILYKEESVIAIYFHQFQLWLKIPKESKDFSQIHLLIMIQEYIWLK